MKGSPVIKDYTADCSRKAGRKPPICPNFSFYENSLKRPCIEQFHLPFPFAPCNDLMPFYRGEFNELSDQLKIINEHPFITSHT